MMQMLLETGANTSIKDNIGESILTLTQVNTHSAVAHNAGASPSLLDEQLRNDDDVIIPPATKLGGGGILESPCPSVRLSVRL